MKVMQTLGRHGGHQEGIFQYRRDVQGVQIDGSVGQAPGHAPPCYLTNAEWTHLLEAIANAPQSSFRLTPGPQGQPPNQNLYQLISDTIPHPQGGWNWNDSLRSYVCAILEHEGSIDLYAGALGPHHSVFIALARDIPAP